jgi:hypothetical protein
MDTVLHIAIPRLEEDNYWEMEIVWLIEGGNYWEIDGMALANIESAKFQD